MLLVFIGISAQIAIMQRSSARALTEIADTVAQIKASAPPVMKNTLTSTDERAAGFVHIDGQIARPGTYGMPETGRLSIKQLIAAAGGIINCSDARVTVTEMHSDGTNRERLQIEHYRADLPMEFRLAGNDYVHIEPSPANAKPTTAPARSDEQKPPAAN